MQIEEEETPIYTADNRVMSRDDYKDLVAQAIVDDDLGSIPEIVNGADLELENEVKEALEDYKYEN